MYHSCISMTTNERYLWDELEVRNASAIDHVVCYMKLTNLSPMVIWLDDRLRFTYLYSNRISRPDQLKLFWRRLHNSPRLYRTFSILDQLISLASARTYLSTNSLYSGTARTSSKNASRPPFSPSAAASRSLASKSGILYTSGQGSKNSLRQHGHEELFPPFGVGLSQIWMHSEPKT